ASPGRRRMTAPTTTVAPASPPAVAPPDAPGPADQSDVELPGWAAEAGLVLMSAAAGLGLCRLYADGAFLGPVLLAVAAVHILAIACRRRGLNPLVSLAVSAAGLAVFVTWVIEPNVSLIPGPAVWHAASADLNEAWRRFGEVVAPTKMTRGFALGSVLGVWLCAFVADTFAFRARTRVEAIVPSFTVFLFGALLGGQRNRLLAAFLYLAAALLFVVLAEVSARPQARPWVSGLRGPGEGALLRSGLGMAAAALVLGLLVGPHLPGAYDAGLLGWRNKTGTNGTRVTLSPLVDIRGRLVGQSDIEMFSVAADAPAYWRVTSLDRFDGTIWSSLSNYRPAGRILPGVGADAGRAPTSKVTQDFVIEGLSSIWLPAAYRPDQLSPTGDVRFDPDSASLATDKATSDGLHYKVESSLPRLTADDLAPVTSAVPADIAARYLSLPGNISNLVRRTAQQVAGSQPTPYTKAKALQDWFRANFTYNLQVAPGHDERAMDQFLTQRQGYCEQFAGTYAAMARLLGLPARVAVGFTSGTRESDGRYHVTGKEAHAWPEVYLNGYGWVAFEPTPGRGQPGAEAYTDVPAAQVTAAPPEAAPAPAATGSTVAPTPETTVAVTVPPAASAPAGRPWIPATLALGLPALAYLIGVPLANRRRRRLRRAAAATPADRVLVAWEDAEEDLAAVGLGRRASETAAEFAHRVGRSAGPAGPPLARLADDTAAAAWSSGGVATEVAVRAEAGAAAITVELDARSTWRERAAKALDPRRLRRRRATPRGGSAS
ncbi:MAG: DUF3488 and transglutaminase-like domain-containing protein, partial [Actinomycetota bacterium]|nr:DUF3488 and transglutaminase-like domain-containing protein [Actinomycetota bacterium]